MVEGANFQQGGVRGVNIPTLFIASINKEHILQLHVIGRPCLYSSVNINGYRKSYVAK